MRTGMFFAGLLVAFSVQAQTPGRKRIAVLDFEYGTVSSGVAAIFGANVDIGKGIADLMVEKFVTGGVYSVIERKALDKIIAEQNLSNSDRVDSATGARIGKILGVNAIIVGSITQFGRDDKKSEVGGLGGVTGRFGIGGVGKRESKAVVAITGRLVDVNTAQILAVATGRGESKRSGATLMGAGGSGSVLGGGAYDLTSKNFADTIIGEATNAAVSVLSRQIEQQSTALPTVKVSVAGLVADVSGKTLILNVGKPAGIEVGMKLAVQRVGRVIKDPATGKVLRELTDSVGEITITEVDDVSSTGQFSGAGTPKVGDKVATP